MKTAKLLALLLIISLGLSWVGYLSLAKTKPYYSGDAIQFEDKVLVASTNSGAVEIFQLQGNQLNLVTKFKAGDVKYANFYDALFDIDNSRLILYLTSGRTLYQYDATNLERLILLKKVTDNSWDWFGDLEKVDGRLVTMGSKFIKVWNSDLQVIDAYRVVNKNNPYNLVFGYGQDYIYNLNGNRLEIFNRQSRKTEKTLTVNYSSADGNRRLHPDKYDHQLYVVDDASLKKFGLYGGLYQELPHSSGHGYDVVYSTDGEHLYFSNGLAVTKIAKADLSVVKTYQASQGLTDSWAMGLKRLMINNIEHLIVFNNSNILILNQKLEPIAQVAATETDDRPIITENLWLRLSAPQARGNEVITVSGGGYTASEKIIINFMTARQEATTDSQGRFTAELRLPLINFTEGQTEIRNDIKATGQNSGLHYSIGFTLVK